MEQLDCVSQLMIILHCHICIISKHIEKQTQTISFTNTTTRIFLYYFTGGSFPLQNAMAPVSKQYSFVNQLPNLICKVINLVICCSCSIKSPTNKCLLTIKKQYLPSPLNEYVLVLQYFCPTMKSTEKLQVIAQISQNILQNAYTVCTHS